MKLEYLIKDTGFKAFFKNNDRDITGLSINSNEIVKDNAFIAIRGAHLDGHQFINEAINKGASTIILEKLPLNKEKYKDINFVQYDDTQEILGYLAASFYNHPADDLTVIGVTGTKGKTTVVNMIKTVLEENGIKTGISGTLGINFNNTEIKTFNTTPDSITLHKYMRKMVDYGCTHFIMEASSQGFKRKRTNGLQFDIGIILNIDRDHIGKNEHKDFKDYLNCKLKIFEQSDKVIVNSGDKIWNYLSKDYKQQAITFSTNSNADYKATEINPFIDNYTYGSRFRLNNLNYYFETIMPGEINVQNALATIAVLDQLGYNLLNIKNSIRNFQSNGRTEILKSPTEFNRTVFIDFAHNRLSIKSVLNNLRTYNPKKLVCVFGLHWNETKMRRYDQGYAAGKYSDLAILTEDHRGPESFNLITQDVIKGLEDSGGDYYIVEDREKAIIQALNEIDENDILVIFGMGHERIQKRENQEVYFNEEEIIYNYLKQKNQ